MIDEVKMRSKKSARSSKRKNDKFFANDCIIYIIFCIYIEKRYCSFWFRTWSAFTRIMINSANLIDVDTKIANRLDDSFLASDLLFDDILVCLFFREIWLRLNEIWNWLLISLISNLFTLTLIRSRNLCSISNNIIMCNNLTVDDKSSHCWWKSSHCWWKSSHC
jgi:hypothetical protein